MYSKKALKDTTYIDDDDSVTWKFYSGCLLRTEVHKDLFLNENDKSVNEPRHDKTNKVSVRPAKTQISLGIRPV